MTHRRAAQHTSRRLVRIRGRLLRLLAHLDRRTLALGMLVASIGGVLTGIAALSVNGIPLQNRYPFSVTIPASTPPLKPGDQVRVAGKIAGLITHVEPGRDTVRADAELDRDYAPIGRDARITVGVILGTSLAYLVLDPGDARDPLPEHGEIPRSRVQVHSSLPQALEAFDAATRVALGRDLEVMGEGVVGRGSPTNAAVKDLRAVAVDGVPLLDAVTPSPGVLGRAVRSAEVATRGLRGQRSDDVGAGLTAARATLETYAARRERTAGIVKRLAKAEAEALRTLPVTSRSMTEVAAMLHTIGPGAQAITDQLPDLERLFSSAVTVRDEAGRFGRAARRVLSRLAPILIALRAPAGSLQAALIPLAALGASVDTYSHELGVLARGLRAAFGYEYVTQPALRISGSLACHARRNPYPAPGAVFKDRQGC